MPHKRQFKAVLVIAFVIVLVPGVVIHEPMLAAGPTATPTLTPQPTPTPSVLVNSLLDDPNGCPQTCTLRSAINSVPSGGIVGFADALSGTIKLAETIEISKDVTIASSSANPIVIDGQGQLQLIVVQQGKVRLQGLKFQHGSAKRVGGAIEVQGGSLEVYDSVFDSNTANEGGAVSISGNLSLTLANVVFTNNKAGGGGALYTEILSTVEISDSLFQDNTATFDGGAISNRGKTEITRTSFVGNKVHKSATAKSSNGGGAISNLQSTKLNILDCTFSKNQSDSDAGVLLNTIGSASPNLNWVVIDSSTFEQNVADGNGGAIANNPTSPMTIVNSTFAGNLARGSGGAFYNKGLAQISFSTIAQNGAKGTAGGIFTVKPVNLASSIVAGNIGKPVADISGPVKSGGSNLIGSPAGTTSLFLSDQQKVDPMLQPLALNDPGLVSTMGLQSGSPAIGKGGTSCPDTDERGAKRKSPCDVGAFETQ